MTYINLCDRDPLVNMLHEVFGANIVRVPDARILPLCVVVQAGNKTLFRGALEPLLAGPAPLGVVPTSTPVADIAGRRSRTVKLDLGMFILRGFLGGLGVPANGLNHQFEGVEELSFSFPGVQRVAADIGQLGRALAGRRLDLRNPAAAPLAAGQTDELLVIDSVLTSKSIVVNCRGKTGRQMELNFEGLASAVAGAGGKMALSQSPETQLTIESARELTFAFTCVRLFTERDGVIAALPPDLRARTLGAAAEQVRYSPDRYVLHPQPGILLWDR